MLHSYRATRTMSSRALGGLGVKGPGVIPDVPAISIRSGSICDLESEFSGLWESAGGSLYTFDGRRFVCVEVHSVEYRGWVGKVAVDDVRPAGSISVGLQAFRCKATGALSNWAAIELCIEKQVVTKFFPEHISASRLIYGHVERYFRVLPNRWH